MRISKKPKVRQQEILATARSLMEKQGLSKTTMAQIAREMNVAKGLLYYYYPSKTKMVAALFDTFSESFEMKLKQRLQDAPPDFVPRVQIFFRSFFEMIQENDALLSFSAEDPGMHRMLQEKLCRLAFDLMLAILGQAETQNEINLRHPQHMLRLLIFGLADLHTRGIKDATIHAALAEQILGLPPETLQL